MLLNAYLPFFIETASQEQANIFNFAKFLSSGSSIEGATKLMDIMAKGSVAFLNLSNILSLTGTETTHGCIVSTATSYLQPLIKSRELCRMMSRSTFDMKSLGRKKTVVYLIVPDEKTTFNFIITAFVKQVYEVLINEAQQMTNKALPVRVNFVLDEFCNVPKIPDMASMISAARSRNMRFFLYVQGMRQLQGKYGYDAETIKGNCENLVFLNSREHGLLKEFSTLCGNTSFTDLSGNVGIRPLISTSDLQRLCKDSGQALILHGRHYPFMTELPDIDQYSFKRYPPVEIKDEKLTKLMLYDEKIVFQEVKNNARPIPFSDEVHGKLMYYGQKAELDGTESPDIEASHTLVDEANKVLMQCDSSDENGR